MKECEEVKNIEETSKLTDAEIETVSGGIGIPNIPFRVRVKDGMFKGKTGTVIRAEICGNITTFIVIFDDGTEFPSGEREVRITEGEVDII